MTTEEAVRIKRIANSTASGFTPEEAEDIAQEVLLYCLTNENTYRSRQIQHITRDVIRARHGRNVKNKPVFIPLETDVPSPENPALHFEIDYDFRRRTMGAMRRAMIRLDAWWGMTDVEIADLFGKSVTWVANVKRGRTWKP